jgi:hypothetical protein
MTPLKTIRTTLVSAIFWQLGRNCFELFFILQDKHNIGALSFNIKLICIRCETGLKKLTKVSLFYQFLMNLIFSNNVHIYCIFNKKTNNCRRCLQSWNWDIVVIVHCFILLVPVFPLCTPLLKNIFVWPRYTIYVYKVHLD